MHTLVDRIPHSPPLILITGANGQLGKSLQVELEKNDLYQLIYSDIDELDITDAAKVNELFAKIVPDVCINAAAYTAVDRAEEDTESAFAINATGPANLAKACARHHSTLLHISSDYVYHSIPDRKLQETDPLHPQGAYAKSKREGEEAILRYCSQHIILRTSWLYSEFGHNFLKTMLQLGMRGQDIRVVSDQVGAPTYARDLAKAIIRILDSLFYDKNEASSQKTLNPIVGIYNFSNEGETSWYGFACKIFEWTGLDINCQSVRSTEYPMKAPRPQNSRLALDKIKTRFNLEIQPWEEALSRCLANMQNSLPG